MNLSALVPVAVKETNSTPRAASTGVRVRSSLKAGGTFYQTPGYGR